MIEALPSGIGVKRLNRNRVANIQTAGESSGSARTKNATVAHGARPCDPFGAFSIS